MTDHLGQSETWVPSDGTRAAIRTAAAELTETRGIPPERFPGHKSIYCANLEGWLGGFTLALLNALEASEGRVGTALWLIRAARAGAEVTGQHGTIQLLDQLEAALTVGAEPEHTPRGRSGV